MISPLRGTLTPLVAPLGGDKTVVYDQFTDADGTPIASHTPNKYPVGSSWILDSGSITITGNKATGGDGIAVIDSGLSNCTISGDFQAVGGGTLGMIARYSSGASFWLLGIAATPGSGLWIYEWTGTFYVFRASASTPQSYYSLRHLVVTLSGNTLSLTDGDATVSYTSSVGASATKHGMRLRANETLDEFKVER